MEGGGQDEEVASSSKKKKNKLKTRVQKSIPYLWLKWRQNSQHRYPINDQNGWKTLPFWAAHTYIAHIRENPPPPPSNRVFPRVRSPCTFSLSAPNTFVLFSSVVTLCSHFLFTDNIHHLIPGLVPVPVMSSLTRDSSGFFCYFEFADWHVSK